MLRRTLPYYYYPALSELNTVRHVYLLTRAFYSSIQVRNVFLLKLFKLIQSRPVNDFFILTAYNGTVYYAAFILIHRSKIHMQFLYLLFTFTVYLTV